MPQPPASPDSSGHPTRRRPRTRVVVLFGGQSAEHEVSILSARNVAQALDTRLYEPVAVSISKEGVWRLEPEATLAKASGDPRTLKLAGTGPALLPPTRWQASHERPAPFDAEELVVFPVLHGTNGEDGRVQGLLELAGLAFVGAGTLGAAAAMDKDASKRLLKEAGVPVVPWVLVRQEIYEQTPNGVETEHLGYPQFVKPCRAGSSVGVSRVESSEALAPALKKAFAYDDKVLIEAGIDAREIECAVLGETPPRASIPGEIVVTHTDGFYSYEAKYVDEGGSHSQIPADLPEAVLNKIKHWSLKAFEALDLAGLARVDFFVSRADGSIYLNEVNALPGFTPISMYPQLWRAEGLSTPDLVGRLVEAARARHARTRALLTSV